MTYPIRAAEYGAQDYKNALDLRFDILRKPLGLHFTPEELEMDKKDQHVVALDGRSVIGCLTLMELDQDSVRLRQVAVSEKVQGQGVGKDLVLWAENYARQKGYKKIIVGARANAVGFYERLGYDRVGDVYTEVTLPHWKMEKTL